MVQQTFEDYLDLSPIEQGRETNAISAAVAGLISGVIKVPEGVVSLGAELIDAGFDTNTAEEVEKFFDKINVFEEIADDSAVGKIVETLVQVGVPGTIGFKLASGAVKAKKAGNYANLKSKNFKILLFWPLSGKLECQNFLNILVFIWTSFLNTYYLSSFSHVDSYFHNHLKIMIKSLGA